MKIFKINNNNNNNNNNLYNKIKICKLKKTYKILLYIHKFHKKD